jgi:ubiquinone/menaquinone biosynthesis C-methylase UbiE
LNKVSTQLQHEYRKRFNGNDSYRDHIWRILCEKFFSKYISREDTLLDLGAGWGEFSRNVHVKKKYAMDLNPDCGDKVVGHSIFLLQDCSSTWPLEDNSLDVVFTSNFLEHLPNKDLVDKTLDEAFRCIKPGGKIICLGPNIKYVKGNYWDYWDHYIPITEESMAESLMLRGFCIKEKVDKFLPYTMSTGIQPPIIALKVYLRFPFLWKFFGKQFLVVAQKT